MELSKPLVLWAYARDDYGNIYWVHFHYENVFIFCKKCGRIGHHDFECALPGVVAKEEVKSRISGAARLGHAVIPGEGASYSGKIRAFPIKRGYLTTRLRLGQRQHPASTEPDLHYPEFLEVGDIL